MSVSLAETQVDDNVIIPRAALAMLSQAMMSQATTRVCIHGGEGS